MPIQTTRMSDHIAVMTVDRESALNALNGEVLDELRGRIAELAADRAVRCLVLRGAGPKAFVAGADVKEMLEMNAAQAAAFAEKGHAVMDALERFPSPVIAAVHGFALGGGFELALSADMIVCSPKALFGFPEVTIGLIPGFGGTLRLRRAVGEKIAADLLYTGRKIGGEEAFRLGLASRLLAHDTFDDEVARVAGEVAAAAPLSNAAAKAVVRAARTADAEQGRIMETQSFGIVASLNDKRRGIEALLSKGKARYEGN